MAKFNFENIWKIMKNYNFSEVKIDEDMNCALCYKIMINAHNAPCGCRFCLECISKYLNEEEKFCPGNKDDCKLELISLNENVSIDRPMNNKISRLIVKCPENSCDYEDELRKIQSHISQCNSRSINCPYINIGCNKSDVSLIKLADHIRDDGYNHSKLLMDCIDNLNNEMNEIKIIVENLKEELSRKIPQLDLSEIQSKFEQQKQEINLLNQSMINLRSIDFVDRSNSQLKFQNKIFSENNLSIPSLVSNENIQTNHTRFVIKKKESDLATLSNKIDDAMKFGLAKLVDMEINLKQVKGFEFLWKIDKFNDKLKTAKKGKTLSIFSDPFFIEKYGYKMCLQLFPNGTGEFSNTHLSVFFCLMKGDFDDILEWPFKNHFSFALINQRTRLPFVRATTSYDTFKITKCLDKPIFDKNIGYGYMDFIELNEITNDDWTKNDQIFMRFRVNYSL